MRLYGDVKTTVTGVTAPEKTLAPSVGIFPASLAIFTANVYELVARTFWSKC